jgi:PilZ domain-containing protein
MSQRHTYAAIDYVPECDQATADQVFEILERWRKRSEDHYSNRRKDHRFPYPNRALVVVTVTPSEDHPAPPYVVVKVQTRNLSCGGVSLLVAPVYVPQKATDATPLLSAERLFAPGRELSIGLPQPGEEYLWMRGTIVRSRVVHFGFRECGVSFLARHCPETTSG